MFQAPWMLAGLVVAALILLAHRLFSQPAKQVALSSIRLIPIVKEQPTAPRRWQDLSLMALRLLAWAALALAVARPQCAVNQTLAVFGQPQSALIVLDAGARSHHEVQGQALWTRALTRAEDVVRALPARSWVSIAALEPGLTQISPGLAREQALSALSAWRQGDLFARQSMLNLDEHLSQLESALQQAPPDLPKVGYWVGEIGERKGAAPNCPPQGTSLSRWFCISSIPQGEPPQLRPQFAVTKLEQRRSAQLGSQTVELVAEVDNLGTPTESAQLELDWSVDGEILHRQRISLKDGRGEATWVYGRRSPGPHRVRAQLHAARDGFALDDARETWLDRPAPLRVLLVDGDPSEQRGHDEVYLLATALEHAFEDRGLELSSLDPAQLEHVLQTTKGRPEDFDAVILANVAALSQTHSEALAQWVRMGVGLWMTAGGRVDATQYNQRLDALLPLLLRPGSVAPDTPLTLDAPDFSHPLFSHAAAARDLGGGQTRRIYLLEPDPKRDAHVALRFTNGAPALITREVGKGRVAWWSTTVDLGWTDLVLQPGFVPFCEAVLRWIVGEHASSTLGAPGPILVGAPISLGQRERYAIQGPPGTEPSVAGTQPYRPARAGLYQVSHPSSHHERRFAAVLDPRASPPPRPAPPTAPQRETDENPPMRSYRPVWSYLWILAALALAGESILRMMRMRR